MNLRFSRVAAAIVVVLMVAACGQKKQIAVDSDAAPGMVSTLIKASTDTRQYRPMVLTNGLKVLLISDPESSKAAVSVNVDVGSGADPEGREGLAHFVEHMLFLGTEKYPDADSYQRFISAQGGEHNAYTAFTDTNYFFDVNAEALEPALDRFAQFFIKPLFSPAYLERERLAVDSEYKARLQNELRRYLDVLKTQINPRHPFSRFTIGSEQTLRVDGLADSVRQFYQQHYFASNMSLVVAGANSLDELEAMVSARFSKIVTGQKDDNSIRTPLFDSDEPKLLYVKPLKDSRSVNISFELPDLQLQNLNKPLQLIGHLLGHEGETSLFQYLKTKLWAESLSAGTFLDYPGGGLFSINIGLTELGSDYIDNIVAAVFAEIRALSREPDLAARYSELARIADLQFDYQSTPKILPYVRGLAASLSEYPMAYWLKGNYAMQGYDGELLADLLARMSPARAVISITDPGVKTNAVSPWFNVDYRAAQVSGEQLKLWREAALPDAISFPDANPYIPEATAIIDSDDEQPQLMVDELGYKLWFQSVNRFAVPRAAIRATLSNSGAGKTVEQAAVFAIAAKMLGEQFNRSVYDAKAMGYRADVSAASFGLELHLSGFNQKLPLLLEQLLGGIKQVSWDGSEFEQSRDELIRRWRNFALEPPYKQLMNLQQADFVDTYWTTAQLANAAEKLSFADFISAWQQQSQFDFVEALCLGNFDRSAADSLAKSLSAFKPRARQAATKPQPKVAAAEFKAAQLLSAHSTDHAALVYLQSPTDGLRSRAITALTARLLESSFFHQLRTEQQFGYIVFLGNRLLEQQPGLMMVVQSPSRDSEAIINAIDRYWEAVLAGELGISEADFVQHKQSLAETLLKPPINNEELLEFMWRDLDAGYFGFDQSQQLVDALETIEYADWLVFTRDLWTNQTIPKMQYLTDR